ncbi:MAG: esterase-like activity of phytase family protein [Phycisphaeraceae bacterium]|nr:esterase-like activity of phytase family protein [Phycisphaeraceae bacterium]
MLRTAIAASVLATCAASAQLSISHIDSANLPSSTTDQHGASFTITGLSGVTRLGGTRYAAAMDNSNKLVLFDLALDPAGEIDSISNVAGLSLTSSGDHEGIALSGPGTVLVSDEGPMTLKEFALADGALVRTIPTPAVFASRRGNRGLESLSIAAALVWTANEEALTPDGPAATPSAGTVVRLLHIDASSGAALAQFAYVVEPMHGPYIPIGNPGQSGLSDLVALPDGTLLGLERSLALTDPLLLTRIFEIDRSGASDISALAGLQGATYTPVSKSLLYSGGQTNLEGLCLGPALGSGGHALIGIVDDGDPISANTVIVFRLDGLVDCAADVDGDGDADGDDFFAYLNLFAAGDAAADLDGDGDRDADDFFFYLDLFARGC